MISDFVMGFILFFGGLTTLLMVVWMCCEFHPISALSAAVSVAFMATMIVGLVNSFERVKSDPPKYYAVQDVGTTEAPRDVAALNGWVFDITGRFFVVLYNPELYYLEEQSYSCPCNGWCLVTYHKASTYRVVPRSLVEVQ